MEQTIKLLELINTMGISTFMAILFLLGITGFISIFCWATIKYVPIFVKHTGRIADNLEAINKSHDNINMNTQRLPFIDDKVDKIIFLSEEIKKKIEDIHSHLRI